MLSSVYAASTHLSSFPKTTTQCAINYLYPKNAIIFSVSSGAAYLTYINWKTHGPHYMSKYVGMTMSGVVNSLIGEANYWWNGTPSSPEPSVNSSWLSSITNFAGTHVMGPAVHHHTDITEESARYLSGIAFFLSGGMLNLIFCGIPWKGMGHGTLRTAQSAARVFKRTSHMLSRCGPRLRTVSQSHQIQSKQVKMITFKTCPKIDEKEKKPGRNKPDSVVDISQCQPTIIHLGTPSPESSSDISRSTAENRVTPLNLASDRVCRLPSHLG